MEVPSLECIHPLGVALVCIFTDNPPQPLLDLLSDRQDGGKEKALPLRRRPGTLILSICYRKNLLMSSH